MPQREKAHIIVIGGAHAGHLENLENSNDVKKIAAEKHEFFYSPVTLKLPEIRKPVEDLNALRKYHDVITSVVKEFIYCNAAWR